MEMIIWLLIPLIPNPVIQHSHRKQNDWVEVPDINHKASVIIITPVNMYHVPLDEEQWLRW